MIFLVKPDVSIPKLTIIKNDDYITILQRKWGLYCSVLYAALKAHERLGNLVGQHDYLGDAAINKQSKTTRHNDGLYALHNLPSISHDAFCDAAAAAFEAKWESRSASRRRVTPQRPAPRRVRGPSPVCD